MKMFIKSFLLAILTVMTFASYAFVGPGQSVKVPVDGNLPTYLHNAPVVLEHFEDNTAVKVPLGSSQPSVLTGTQVEYFWITNGGDSTKKPDLSITASRTGFVFRDTLTGIESPAWTLKWGETGLFVQEVGDDKMGHFTKLVSQPGPPPTYPSNGRFGNILIQNAAGYAKLWLTFFTTGSGHNNAPGNNDFSGQHIQIGGKEYGSGSVRKIGFGFVAGTGEWSPAYIGYQELNEAASTNGDLIFGTRAGTGNTNPDLRLRITASGDLLAGTGYTPKQDQSLVTKKYADRVRGGAFQYAKDFTLTSLRSGDVYAATPSAAMAFTVPAATTLGAVGGDRISFVSYAPKDKVVTITTADDLLTHKDSGVVTGKTFSINPGESATIVWEPVYKRWLLILGASSAMAPVAPVTAESGGDKQ